MRVYLSLVEKVSKIGLFWLSLFLVLFAIGLFWLSSHGKVYAFCYDIRHSRREYMLLMGIVLIRTFMLLLMLGSMLRVGE